jgi:hypothetical protein
MSPQRMLRAIGPQFLALFLLVACAPLIGAYNERAYLNATTLKAHSLALVAKSGDEFATHREAAEALMVEVDAAYEYANGLPGNTIAAQQWRALKDPDGALLGGFVRLWRDAGRISPAARPEIGAQIAEAFDQIICLEINKARAQACAPAPG